MKKIIYALLASAVLLTSCQEFEPVFITQYPNPDEEKTYTQEEALAECAAAEVTTIAALAARYTHGSPFTMSSGMIAGRVSTTDQPGNFYKSLYIQDETGGMEIKIGLNRLYNDYQEGQMLYIKLNGLCLGEYGYKTGYYGGNGMVQIGFDGEGTDYETSYLQVPLLINTHILKGVRSDIKQVTPVEIKESQLPSKSGTISSCPYIGKLVTLKGLKYADENFCLLYINSKQDKKSYTNRIFLSDTNPGGGDKTHSITTWAMSREKMTNYLCSGVWDACKVGSGSEYSKKPDGSILTVGDFKEDGYKGIEKSAYSVSQYFLMGSTEIQIRTSGYCKFSDKEIPSEVLNKTATLDVTGILTLYQGSIQLTVNSLSDFVVNGEPLNK